MMGCTSRGQEVQGGERLDAGSIFEEDGRDFVDGVDLLEAFLDARQVTRTALRGLGAGNGVQLPDIRRFGGTRFRTLSALFATFLKQVAAPKSQITRRHAFIGRIHRHARRGG